MSECRHDRSTKAIDDPPFTILCATCGAKATSNKGPWTKEQELRDAQPGGSTPSQYALPKGAAELQDLIEFREMNFAMGNIFKACYRKKDAVDRLYDIRKIIWFAQREEQRLMKEESAYLLNTDLFDNSEPYS